MEKNLVNKIINLTLFVVGIALFIVAQGIKTGAVMGQGGDLLPKLCSALWVGLSGAMVVFNFCGKSKTPAEAGEKSRINMKDFFMSLAFLFIYILFLNSVGFVIMSVIYLFLQILLFTPKDQRTKKNYIIIAALSLIIPVAVDQLFANAFSLIMPTGLLKF